MHLLPRKRPSLLTQSVGNETIVYDQSIHKAFCLNAAAAAIWHQCDGASTLADAAQAASRAVGAPVAAETALLTLTALGQEGLFEGNHLPQPLSDVAPDLSRRRVLGGLGSGAALLVPVVFGLMTPRPAEAYSCIINLAGVKVCTNSSQPGGVGQSSSNESMPSRRVHGSSGDSD